MSTGQRYRTATGTYALSTLPGCPQVCVSHAAFTLPQYRGSGAGQADHEERLRVMEALHYDCAIATVVESNERQKHILEKFGWSKVHTFTNRATGNVVGLWVRSL